MLKRYTFIFFFVISLQKIAATQSGPDSVTVLASHQYKNPTTFKKIFIGSNYRKEWSTPVTMHLFDIKGNHREFEIVKTGGGDQTTSLHLDDKNERDWVLRSVDKNIEKVLPPVLRKTFIKKLVQDIISASYPYAGLTVSYLSNAAKVVTGSQQLYFVPDDPALGQYRSVMANRVCILVNRQPVSKNDLETGEMMEKLSEDNLYSVDQKEFLKARLIDWLVADWDRHAGQLRWLPHEVKGRIFFYPLPRDRDQAFFYSNGLLVKLVTLFAMPYLKGFKKMSTGIKQLSKKLRKMDEVFLNELDRNDWQRIIKSFQQNVTNRVIEIAVKKQPPEIYSINGKEIINKLESRRKGLMKNVMKYYSFLAKKVIIRGSGKSEFFKVLNMDHKTNVSVYDYSNGDTSKKIYSRWFDTEETKTICIEGLEGGDHCQVEGEKNNIKLVFKEKKKSL